MPTLADGISRKWALTVVVVIFNIGAIMQTVAKSYAVLVAGRTIGGIGVGTLAMVRWMHARNVANDLWLTFVGRSNLHIWDVTSQPPRNAPRPRIRFYRRWCRCLILDHIRHPQHCIRSGISRAVWSANGWIDSSRYWRPPKQGTSKKNIDGSYLQGTNDGAIACVIQDCSSFFIDGFKKNVRASSAIKIEAIALLETLQQ